MVSGSVSLKVVSDDLASRQGRNARRQVGDLAGRSVAQKDGDSLAHYRHVASDLTIGIEPRGVLADRVVGPEGAVDEFSLAPPAGFQLF